MTGLVLATALGGFATGMTSLVFARVLAGVFGGPATSIAFSIIADVIPESRRGRAVGAVASAFSIASVLGVPAGLELARRGGWQAPFFAVAGLGLVVTAASIALLPPLRGHLAARAASGDKTPGFGELLSGPGVRLSYAMTAIAMFGGFVLIPNLSTYLQENLRYPRADIGFLYMAGGVVSFAVTRVAGRAVDAFGSAAVATAATALLVTVTYVGYGIAPPPIPIMAVFVLFMLAMTARNVAYNTLTSKVPSAATRARFMSIQSAIQHLASATGAFVSARMLTERYAGSRASAPPGLEHAIDGMGQVALVSIASGVCLPIVMALVEAGVRRRARPVEVRPAPAALG